MDTRIRALTVVPVCLVVLASVVTGCTSSAAPEPVAPATTSASAPPAGGFAYPDKTDPTQVAIALKYGEGNDPSGEIIAGPAALVEDRQFTI